MPPNPKRKLTFHEAKEIQDLWSEYRDLELVLKVSLPEGAPGAWIAESALGRRREIIARLDELFQETAPEVEA